MSFARIRLLGPALVEHLIWQLLWHVADDDSKSFEVRTQPRYIAPYWSWTSLDGQVTFVDPELGMTLFAAVLDARITSKEGQQFSLVSRGYLQLRGHVELLPICLAEFKISDLSILPLLLRSQFFDSDLTLKLALRPEVQPTLRKGRSIGLEHTVAWFLASLTSAFGAREFLLLPLRRHEHKSK